MNKFIGSLASIAVMSAAISPVASAVTTGHVTKITVNCPDISNKTKDKLINYGTYIAGIGTERVNSDAPTHPLFQTPTSPGEIPFDLKAAGYDGAGVKYNPSTGTVTCYFQSSLGFDPFIVSSKLLNARGGHVVSSGDEEIKIKIPVGSI